MEPCHRCDGKGYVKFLLESAYDSPSGEPVWGERDCPHCGGGRQEPDPIFVSEMRAQYGPGWDE